LTTPDMVAAVLRDAIVLGVLEPGESIRQDAVAAELRVSKIPVREALTKLEAEGLVRFLRNRGAEVTQLSVSEMEEVCELRKRLECLALERSVPHLAPADLATAKYLCAQANLAAQAKDPSEIAPANWAFHAALFAGLRDGPLMKMVRQANLLAERYIQVHLRMTNSVARSDREHRQILAACEKGDVARATSLLSEHLDKAVATLSAHLRSAGLPD